MFNSANGGAILWPVLAGVPESSPFAAMLSHAGPLVLEKVNESLFKSLAFVEMVPETGWPALRPG